MITLNFNDIINVWSNDAHVISFFISLLYFPPLLIFLGYVYKNQKDNLIKIIFSIIIFTLFPCFIGLFQLTINLIIDISLKAIGIILLINSMLLALFLIYIFNFEEKCFLYKFSRYPFESLIVIISISIFLMNLNLITGLLSLFLYIYIYIKLKQLDKNKMKQDKDYIDIINATPLLFPNIFSIIFTFIKNIFKKMR